MSAALVFELVVRHGVPEQAVARMGGDELRALLAHLRGGGTWEPPEHSITPDH